MKLYEHIYNEKSKNITVHETDNFVEKDKQYISLNGYGLYETYKRRVSKNEIGDIIKCYEKVVVILTEENICKARGIIAEYYKQKMNNAKEEFEKNIEILAGLYSEV